MALKDLSGKTVYDLDPEDFEKLFCLCCREYQNCSGDKETMLGCRVLIDSGIWDKFYRKHQFQSEMGG